MRAFAIHAVAAIFLGILLAVVRADNPIVQTIYTTDPAPVIYDDRVFLFTGHDEDSSTDFNMLDWRLFSTEDMANWQDHGSPIGLTTFSWADANAWAGHVVERNGKFYFYAPIRRRGGSMAIGVGISDNIYGPYTDAIGGPLVENAEIDPAVLIDDDGQAYLYWGNPNLWYVTLNEDMISYSGSLNQVELTVEGFGPREGESTRPTAYEEGPWPCKRNGTYYMLYAGNCCSEDLRYSTGPTATGPWTYGGVLMETEGRSFTNHPGYVEYKGQPYLFYHNGALEGGSGYTRSVAVESFNFSADGSIPQIYMTTEGPAQAGSLDPYLLQEAETIAWARGIETEVCSEGGMNVANINDGDYIKVNGVNFGSAGPATFNARVASAGSGGDIELRLGSETGTLIGTCTVFGTGGWQTWTNVSCPVTGATGTHDLFFRYTGNGTDFLFNVNWWQFE